MSTCVQCAAGKECRTCERQRKVLELGFDMVTSKSLVQRWLHTFVGMMRGEHNTCKSERQVNGVWTFVPKQNYKSQETCEKSAAEMTVKNGRPFDAYQCWFCNGWHIGNAANLTFGKFWSIMWVWIQGKKRTTPKVRPWEQPKQ